jgi:hypothetical protein
MGGEVTYNPVFTSITAEKSARDSFSVGFLLGKLPWEPGGRRLETCAAGRLYPVHSNSKIIRVAGSGRRRNTSAALRRWSDLTLLDDG